MSEVKVEYVKLRKNGEIVKDVGKTLDTQIRSLEDVGKNLRSVNRGISGAAEPVIKEIQEELVELKQIAIKMGEILLETADKYMEAEKRIISNVMKTLDYLIDWEGEYSFFNKDSSKSYSNKDGFEKKSKDDSWSFFTTDGHIDINGDPREIDYSSTVFGGEKSSKSGTIKDSKVNTIYGEEKVSAYGYKGGMDQTNMHGLNRFQWNEERFSFNKESNGSLTYGPGWPFVLGYGFGKSYNVQGGKIEIADTFGTDKNNAFYKGEADVLSADVNAEVKNGRYVDEDGDLVWGFKASGGASAYLVNGEITAGWEFAGISISATYSTGIGYGAGAEVEMNSQSVTIGGEVAKLLGLGVDLSMDWSEADEETIKYIEKYIDWKNLRV